MEQTRGLFCMCDSGVQILLYELKFDVETLDFNYCYGILGLSMSDILQIAGL